jgi:hypothetical protein
MYDVNREPTTAELATFMLRRLERFAALAASPVGNIDRAAYRLARHATLSAYRDCVALGRRAEAEAVLSRTLRAAQAA